MRAHTHAPQHTWHTYRDDTQATRTTRTTVGARGFWHAAWRLVCAERGHVDTALSPTITNPFDAA